MVVIKFLPFLFVAAFLVVVVLIIRSAIKVQREGKREEILEAQQNVFELMKDAEVAGKPDPENLEKVEAAKAIVASAIDLGNAAKN